MLPMEGPRGGALRNTPQRVPLGVRREGFGPRAIALLMCWPQWAARLADERSEIDRAGAPRLSVRASVHLDEINPKDVADNASDDAGQKPI